MASFASSIDWLQAAEKQAKSEGQRAQVHQFPRAPPRALLEATVSSGLPGGVWCVVRDAATCCRLQVVARPHSGELFVPQRLARLCNRAASIGRREHERDGNGSSANMDEDWGRGELRGSLVRGASISLARRRRNARARSATAGTFQTLPRPNDEVRRIVKPLALSRTRTRARTRSNRPTDLGYWPAQRGGPQRKSIRVPQTRPHAHNQSSCFGQRRRAYLAPVDAAPPRTSSAWMTGAGRGATPRSGCVSRSATR